MMGRHTRHFIPLLLAAAVLICCPGCIFQDATYPEITPDSRFGGISEEEYSFRFMDWNISIAIPIDNAVLAGARSADKSAHLYKDLEESEWLPPYYLSFIDDPDLTPFYDTLGVQFSGIRADTDLDDDQYLEMIAVFVQSIPYLAGDDDTNPKFPIETLADNAGDCDDKCLLLAGLLAREGYDVALLYFGPENHMAVGVRCEDGSYAGTGYAYLETTDLSWIGIPPDELENGVVLVSAPQVIPVGTGTKGYGAYDQTVAINRAFLEAKAVIKPILPEIEALNDDLDRQQDELSGLKAEMNALLAAGKTSQYNRLVAEYNSKVSAYNSDLARFRALNDQFEGEAEVYNYILNHRFDRSGTYAWLVGNGRVG
jgi:hypothetical protein